ncbi:MAG: ribosome silencing factor [Burkholderiales bacterium]|nr:ribosome silencing factor [Burkholderiales bacterium]MDE2078642.1 ribosome silencing factor [Burkholderiales bacterium]MDE2433192.1 ribosome silencing factor [Burkholderiales bacterium]HET8693767.1 ribosome silencing factor [Aquabacterium sp.]
MDIRKLQRAIVDGLEDVKAQDIAVFNTEHLSPLFERVIIASGTSNRQTKALASSVRQAVKEAGFQVMRTEGEDNGEWIIVDCAAAVVHIMQPAIRQYYQLEEIWGEKPVAIKVKAAKTSLVKASEPMDEEKPVKPKKASGKVTAAKKAATTAPSKKMAAKKAPAKKSSAVKPATAEKAPIAKKAAAKKVVAKKVVAKKAASVKKVLVNAPTKKKAPAAKKVAAKKVVTRKVAAKKAPARKTAR